MTLKYDAKTGEWIGETGGIDITKHNKKMNDRVVTQTRVAKQKRTHDEIMQTIMSNPNYAFAYRLFDHIKSQMQFDDLKKLIFRNLQHCDYNPNTHVIRFGYQCIDHFIENGFDEYATMRYVWTQNNYNPYKKMTGKQAVWATMLHEIAHHLQNQRGGIFYGSSHNHFFANALNELIILFPFDECESI